MSTPVVTSKWAGNFDCGVCRRKRLMAEEFSRSALEKHRRTGGPLRCKQCTAKQEREKRAEARAKNGNGNAKANANADADASGADARDGGDETKPCAGPCQKVLPKDSFNRNQWSKPEGKSRCRECVERSIRDEAAKQRSARDQKLESARKKVRDLESSGTATAREIVAAESELASMEAEKVTGLAPIKLGGRGRGTRSYGRGRGRGRGGGRGGSGRAKLR